MNPHITALNKIWDSVFGTGTFAKISPMTWKEFLVKFHPDVILWKLETVARYAPEIIRPEAYFVKAMREFDVPQHQHELGLRPLYRFDEHGEELVLIEEPFVRKIVRSMSKPHVIKVIQRERVERGKERLSRRLIAGHVNRLYREGFATRQDGVLHLPGAAAHSLIQKLVAE